MYVVYSAVIVNRGRRRDGVWEAVDAFRSLPTSTGFSGQVVSTVRHEPLNFAGKHRFVIWNFGFNDVVDVLNGEFGTNLYRM